MISTILATIPPVVEEPGLFEIGRGEIALLAVAGVITLGITAFFVVMLTRKDRNK